MIFSSNRVCSAKCLIQQIFVVNLLRLSVYYGLISWGSFFRVHGLTWVASSQTSTISHSLAYTYTPTHTHTHTHIHKTRYEDKFLSFLSLFFFFAFILLTDTLLCECVTWVRMNENEKSLTLFIFRHLLTWQEAFLLRPVSGKSTCDEFEQYVCKCVYS